MRRTSRASCLLAAALLLTACTGSPGGGRSAPSVTVPADPAPAVTAEAPLPAGPETDSTSPAGPGPAPGSDGSTGSSPATGGTSENAAPAFSAAELEAAVTAANRSLGLDGEVLSEETLRAVLPEAGSIGPEVAFEPAACAQIAATDSVAAVQDAALAGLAYGAEAEAASVLNVAAYAGSSVLDTLDFIDESVLADCAEVQMSRDGTTVTVTNTRLDVSSTAEETLALDTVVTSPAGSTQLVVVSARTGNVRLVASIPAPGDARLAAGEASLLIDAVLAELEAGSL